MMKRFIVVGGGIAGLSAAYSLVKNNLTTGENFQVTLLEAGDRWGGKITTHRQDGFVIEGGPDTFLATKPGGLELCRELGLESRLQGTNPKNKNTYVLTGGRLEPLPEGLTMMIPTQIGPMIRTRLLSWPAKARMGLEWFMPPKPLNGDESLGSFVSRRLGRPVYERLIEPLMSGIYAGDGDQLSLKATFPYLRDLELQHGGLVKGALALRRKSAKAGARPQGTRSAFLTPTTGLQEMTDALVDRLEHAGASLRLHTLVEAVERIDHGYRIMDGNNQPYDADGIILATPAYAAGELLAGLSSALAGELREIPYASTATVSLAYHKEDLPQPLDGYGYVIPRREGRRALACTWTSTKFPHRAPEGMALLRIFIGRAGQEEDLPAGEPELIDIAREEIRLTLGIQAKPVIQKVFFWEKAMPQYNLGHPARLERIARLLENLPGLALAGNGYHGIGIPDCITSGEKAAKRLLTL